MPSGQDPTLTGADRLIVALDVRTHQDALDLVDQLDNVSFFKVGLQIILAGDLLGLIKKIQERRQHKGGIFIDLKMSGDISHTINEFIGACAALNVRFMTLVPASPEALTIATLNAIRKARGSSGLPQVLMVPVFFQPR